MSDGFVDTGAWLALIMPDDMHHQEATVFFRTLARGVHLVTSNYVLSETYTWLRYRDSHATAVRFHQRIVDAERTGLLSVVWVTPGIAEHAWGIFARYGDQEFSFTDCTSFVISRVRPVDFVFGFDSDFRTMGFDLRPGAR